MLCSRSFPSGTPTCLEEHCRSVSCVNINKLLYRDINRVYICRNTNKIMAITSCWNPGLHNSEVQLLPSRLGESPTRHRHVLAEERSACTRGWETAPSASRITFSSPPVSQNHLLPRASYCTATWSSVVSLIPARDPSIKQPDFLMRL